MTLAVIVLAICAGAMWFVIPAFLRWRFQLPYGRGLLMELLIVSYWLARLLRIPVE